MPNKTSQHILGTASNLLGFCLIVISSLHIAQKTENTLLDEFVSVIAMLLIISCIFSFGSIKTENTKMEAILEKIADLLFVVSLIGIFAIILFLIIKFWNN